MPLFGVGGRKEKGGGEKRGSLSPLFLLQRGEKKRDNWDLPRQRRRGTLLSPEGKREKKDPSFNSINSL